ncbi:hypothetical protein MKW92_003933 [Papaver armeniacum]|nr:hypothetical protein MKW92_006307 [Papaver armeniacum]KAI3956789.1 hypothetical protein MKW92_003933 [Papaver armeniacum]
MEFEPLTIDNAVIEFDMGSGEEDGIDIEHPDEEEEDYGDQIMEGSISQDFFTSDLDSNLEPFEGMEFESEEAARIFYNSYARRIGFSTRVSVYHRSRRDGAIICRQIVCSRQGFRHDRDRDGNSSESRSKRQRAVTRVGCKAMIMVKKQDSGKWIVSKFVKEHNHELVPPDKVHSLRSHRHVSGPARSLIDTLQAAGIGPSGVMSVLIKESGGANNVGFTTVDCRNYMSGSKQKTLGTGAPVLKTPSPMEKQAASLFTRRMFMKFQEELVETLAITATKTEDSGTITTYREAIKFVEEGAKSLHTYNVAIEALHEAAKKVAAVKGPGIGVGSLVNGSHQEVNASEGNQSGKSQSFTADEKDKKILELMSELDTVNQRCEIYRGNLLGVLKDMEEQKLKLSVKVQNVKLNLKD